MGLGGNTLQKSPKQAEPVLEGIYSKPWRRLRPWRWLGMPVRRQGAAVGSRLPAAAIRPPWQQQETRQGKAAIQPGSDAFGDFALLLLAVVGRHRMTALARSGRAGQPGGREGKESVRRSRGRRTEAGGRETTGKNSQNKCQLTKCHVTGCNSSSLKTES